MKKLTGTLLTAIALNACAQEEPPHAGTTEAGVSGMPVEVATIPTAVRVSGDVQSSVRAELATRVMARVTAVDADLGTRVSAGQILIRLGVEDVAAARRRAEAAARLAEAARDEAARHAARMDTLQAQDVVPRVQRDQAHLALTRAETDLAMARAQVDEVDAASAYTEIRAPFSGVVVARSVDPGDLAAPGVPLLVLEGTGSRDAVLAVPLDVSGRIAVGDSLAIEGGEGETEWARVRAVSGGADPRSRTVEVKAALSAGWPTGTAVTGWVPTGAHEGVVVPEEALVRRGQLTGVEVVQDGHVVTRWLRLGQRLADGRVEVLSGLRAGERIVR